MMPINRASQRHNDAIRKAKEKAEIDEIEGDDRMGWPASLALISFFVMIGSIFHSCFAR